VILFDECYRRRYDRYRVAERLSEPEGRKEGKRGGRGREKEMKEEEEEEKKKR
jgi:hypothetical protein